MFFYNWTDENHTFDSGLIENILKPSSFSDRYRAAIVVNVYVAPFLCAFGILGNVLSYYVLGQDRSLQTSARLLLRSLAAADTAFLVTCVFVQPLWTMAHYTDWTPALRHYYPWIEVIIFPLASFAQTTSGWMVFLVAGYRYLAVCRPIFAVQHVTKSRVLKANVCVWVSSFIYNMPRFFEYTLKHHMDPRTGFSSPITEPSMVHNRYYYIVYTTILYAVCCGVIPISGLIFFNLRLAQAANEARTTQRRLRKVVHSSDGRNTRMVIVVVGVFIACQTPATVRRVCSAIAKFRMAPSTLYAVSKTIVYTNLCLTINSSVNFLIYYFYGATFRKTCLELVSKSPRAKISEETPSTQLHETSEKLETRL